jgi:hypothetical protein
MPKFLSRWIVKSRVVSDRLEMVIGWYLFSLMIEAPKHTLTFASSISGLAKSQFSRLLSGHRGLAEKFLETLSQQIGIAWSETRQVLIPGSGWSILLIVDATLHPRSSLHVQNSQRFNHGEGFVIGHQWTNVVLLVNERVIPLPPISFLSKNECRRRGLEYVSEHEKLRVYLKELKLGLWVGIHRADEVVVLMDSAYGDKKLLRLIHGRGWAFVCALRSNRSVRTINPAQEDASQPRRIRHQWTSIKNLFWATRKQAPWETVRDTLASDRKGKRRKEFRARRLMGRLKEIPFDIALVCSEKSKGHGRIYLSCSRTDLPIRAIVLAYRRRWWIELFHRAVKKNLGLLDAGVVEFDSQVSHVHWIYSAYLLLGEMEDVDKLGMELRQRRLAEGLQARRYREILQMATQAGGARRVKTHCQTVLAGLHAA